MIKAYNFSALGQSLLDIAIKVGIFAALVAINFVSAGLTNGTFQLPGWTLVPLALLVSQLDSYVVAWAQKENVPVPIQ